MASKEDGLKTWIVTTKVEVVLTHRVKALNHSGAHDAVNELNGGMYSAIFAGHEGSFPVNEDAQVKVLEGWSYGPILELRP